MQHGNPASNSINDVFIKDDSVEALTPETGALTPFDGAVVRAEPALYGIHRAKSPTELAVVRANKVFSVIHDGGDMLATAYTYASPYAQYARSKWYDSIYFVPTGLVVLTHLIPFPERIKKPVLKQLENFLNVVLSSAFIGLIGQQILELSLGEKKSVNYTIILSVINALSTIIAAPLSIMDTNIREGHGVYPAWKKNICKFILKPLQVAAMPLPFLTAFPEHLQKGPEWMPLVTSTVLGGSMLTYEIVDSVKNNPKHVREMTEKVIINGALRPLGTVAMIFSAIASMIAVYGDGKNVSDLGFYLTLALSSMLLLLSVLSSVLKYSYENKPAPHVHSETSPLFPNNHASDGSLQSRVQQMEPVVVVLDDEDEQASDDTLTASKVTPISMFSDVNQAGKDTSPLVLVEVAEDKKGNESRPASPKL